MRRWSSSGFIATAFGRVLDVAVSEIILNEPRISTLIGQGKAASVAEHVGMSEQGEGSGGAVRSQEQVDGWIGATVCAAH